MSQPVRVAMAITVLLLILCAIALMSQDWDPLSFVLERPEDVPPDQTWGIGYDGQQAYAIALDPFHPSADLDHQAYRYMRIVYPFLVYMLSLGSASLIPWLMIVINIMAAGCSAGLLAGLLQRRAASAWAALIPFITFAYFSAIRLDLNEPLAFLFVLLGIEAWEEKRGMWAMIAFAAAALTKEVTLLFPLILGITTWLYTRERRELGRALVPLAAYVLWALVVFLWIGESPFATAQSNPTILPFSGIRVLIGMQAKLMVILWVVGPAVLLTVLALVDVLRRDGFGEIEAWLVMGNAVFIATLPDLTWFDPLAVLRMGIGLMLSGLLYLARRRRRLVKFAGALWVPSMLLAFLFPGFIL